MKKIISASLLLLLVITFSSYAKTKKKQKTKSSTEKKLDSYGAADEESIKRTEWEFERLKDPVTGKIPNNIREKELAFAATLPSDATSALARTAQTVNWTSRGPYNYGGRTRALAYDIDDENILFAGAVSGGMWRSINGGNSWTKVSALANNQSVTCIAQDKRAGHRSVWYYGSGEAFGASASGGGAFHLGSGLFKSSNSGLSWTKLSSTGANTPQTFDNVWDLIWNVAADSSNSTQDEVYAATYGAIFRSVNGGASWTLARGSSTASPFSYFSDVAVTPSGVVYATLSTEGTNPGVWRSTNGTTWVDISPSFMDTANRIVIGIDPNNENEVFFLAETPGSGQTTTNFLGTPEHNSLWKYTYVSGNGSGAGGLWEDRSLNLPDSGGLFDKFNSQGGYDFLVRVQPGNSNRVVIGGTNLFRSDDAFTSKNNTAHIGGYGIGATLPFFDLYPNHHPDQHAALFSQSNPNVLYSTCDGGIFKTSDVTAPSVTWNSLNQGYLSTQFYTLAIDPATAGDCVIIGGTQDNGTLLTQSVNPTFSWTHPSSGDGAFCAISNGGANYYYSRQEGQLIKTTMGTNGLTTAFTRIDPLMADSSKYLFIAPFVLDPNNNNSILYLTCGDLIYRNHDLSQLALNNTYVRTNQNWDSLSFTRDSTAIITAVSISNTPANRLYYGNNKGRVFRMDNANTGNPVPVNISSTLFPATAYVNCIAIDPNDADKVLLVFSNYNIYSLFYTSNGGATWAKAGGNLEATSSGTGVGPSLRWASILHLGNKTAYFVASSTGVYATDTLKGLTTIWTQQGVNNIGSVVSDVIVTRESDGLVVIGTHGNGVYSANISNINQLITGLNFKSENENFELTNYPNPFTQSTTISFSLKSKAIVELEIMDELGQVIHKVYNGTAEAGIHTEVFNARGIAAGVYYYSLKVNDQRQVKMMVLK